MATFMASKAVDPDSASDELPEGWGACPVRELFGSFGGGTPDRANPAFWGGTIPWLSSGDIKADRIQSASEFITRAGLENSSAKLCRPGSIAVVVRSGILAHTLPVATLQLRAAINQDIKCFDCRNNELNAWLALALKSSAREILALNREGTTVQSVKYDTLREFDLRVPPLTEQMRIVSKIEELLRYVNVSREHLAKVPKILKALRQSVLAAACSGRLTEDWREEHPEVEKGEALLARIRDSHEKHGLGHGGHAAPPTEGVHALEREEFHQSWSVEELKWLCTPGRPITYGILKPGPDWPAGVPYIRVADFPANRLNTSGIRRTSPKIAHEYRRSTLQSGDVLLSIRGTAGRVCRVPRELNGANITQDTARLSVHSEIVAEFVEIYLQCPSVQGRFQAAMKGVAVRGVNIGDVRALQIAIPPVKEQHEIVRRVEILLKLADKIETRISAARKRADQITQSVLAKAFRGELVPTEAELARREGRDYEPASVRLERIKAERARAIVSNNGAGRRIFKRARK